MIVNELEAAELLKSTHFKGSERCIKRRIRSFMASVGIEPVEKKTEAWLYLESDVRSINQWDLNQPKEKGRRIIKSRARLKALGAFEKAQELTH